MRVATFNANSVRARLDGIISWLESSRPDILALQETKVQDGDFPRDAFAGIGYHSVFRGEKSYNGVAVLSRTPPVAVDAGFSDDGPADIPRLLRCDFKGFSLVDTYVPQGRALDNEFYAYKLEWFRRLKRYFSHSFSPRDRLLWVGDMNVALTELDVAEPEKKRENVCFTPEVRARMQEVVDWGFVDLFRKFHPGERLYSFFDYRAPWSLKKREGWRIDYILATKSLAEACTASYIDLDPRLGPRPSDHTYLVADFDI